jgi:hypothetical protein
LSGRPRTHPIQTRAAAAHTMHKSSLFLCNYHLAARKSCQSAKRRRRDFFILFIRALKEEEEI